MYKICCAGGYIMLLCQLRWSSFNFFNHQPKNWKHLLHKFSPVLSEIIPYFALYFCIDKEIRNTRPLLWYSFVSYKAEKGLLRYSAIINRLWCKCGECFIFWLCKLQFLHLAMAEALWLGAGETAPCTLVFGSSRSKGGNWAVRSIRFFLSFRDALLGTELHGFIFKPSDRTWKYSASCLTEKFS